MMQNFVLKKFRYFLDETFPELALEASQALSCKNILKISTFLELIENSVRIDKSKVSNASQLVAYFAILSDPKYLKPALINNLFFQFIKHDINISAILSKILFEILEMPFQNLDVLNSDELKFCLTVLTSFNKIQMFDVISGVEFQTSVDKGSENKNYYIPQFLLKALYYIYEDLKKHKKWISHDNYICFQWILQHCQSFSTIIVLDHVTVALIKDILTSFLSIEYSILNSFETLMLISLAYFGMFSDSLSYDDFLHIFIDDLTSLNSEFTHLGLVKVIHETSYLKLALIYGFLSKVKLTIYSGIIMNGTNKDTCLTEIYDHIMSMWKASDTNDAVNVFFLGKIIDFILSKFITLHSIISKTQVSFDSFLDSNNIRDMVVIYLHGVNYSLHEIQYCYIQSFEKYMKCIELYSTDKTDHIYDQVISNIKNFVILSHHPSVLSLKPFSLILTLIEKKGSNWVIFKLPNLKSFILSNLTSNDYSSKLIHVFVKLVSNSSPQKGFGNNFNLNAWCDEWMIPFLKLDLNENSTLNCNGISRIWSSLLDKAFNLFEYNELKTYLSNILCDLSYYPNVLPLLNFCKQRFPSFCDEYPVISQNIDKLLLSNSEQVSLECLKLICKDTIKAITDLKYQSLLKYFQLQQISQNQYIRDSAFDLFKECFNLYFEKVKIENNPDFEIFYTSFFNLFSQYINTDSYYGKSYLSWQLIEHIVFTSIKSKNDRYISIVFSSLLHENIIYKFIHHLLKSDLYAKDISFSILKMLFLSNLISPSLISKIAKYLFSYAYTLSISYNVQSEVSSSYCYALLSYMPLSEIDINKEDLNIQFQLSDFTDNSRIYLVFYLISLLKSRLNHKKDFANINSIILHPLFSSIRKLYSICSEDEKILINRVIIDIIFEFLNHAMPVISNIAPEGFFLDSTTLKQLQYPSIFQSDIRRDYEETVSSAFINYMWRSTKEACFLLVEISKFTFSTEHFMNEVKGNINTLNKEYEFITHIRSTFLSILTESRHVGLYETTFEAFKLFCLQIWKISDIHFLIEDTLLNFINELDLSSNENKNTPMIYTRRSAGLPFCVEAILVSCPSFKQGTIIVEFINRFKNIINEKSIKNQEEKFVPKIVISLNIMRHLYNNSKLAPLFSYSMAYFMEVSVLGISSLVWTVKNASLLLFSTLTKKIFGSHMGGVCQLSFSQFYQSYPNIYNIIKENLDAICLDPSSLTVDSFPIIQCVLLILKRLAPMNLEENVWEISASKSGKQMYETLGQVYYEVLPTFLGCKSLKIRDLASECMFTFASPEICVNFFTKSWETVSNLISKNDIQANLIHGNLLLMNRILKSIKNYNLMNITLEPIFIFLSSSTIKEQLVKIVVTFKSCRPISMLFYSVLIQLRNFQSNISSPFISLLKEFLLHDNIHTSFFLKEETNFMDYNNTFYQIEHLIDYKNVCSLLKHINIIIKSCNRQKIQLIQLLLHKMPFLTILTDINEDSVSAEELTTIATSSELLRDRINQIKLSYIICSYIHLKSKAEAHYSSYKFILNNIIINQFTRCFEYPLNTECLAYLSLTSSIIFNTWAHGYHEYFGSIDELVLIKMGLCNLLCIYPSSSVDIRIVGAKSFKNMLLYCGSLFKQNKELTMSSGSIMCITFYGEYLLLQDTEKSIRDMCNSNISEYIHKYSTPTVLGDFPLCSFMSLHQLYKVFAPVILNFILYLYNCETFHLIVENPAENIILYLEKYYSVTQVSLPSEYVPKETRFNELLFDEVQIFNDYYDHNNALKVFQTFFLENNISERFCLNLDLNTFNIGLLTRALNNLTELIPIVLSMREDPINKYPSCKIINSINSSLVTVSVFIYLAAEKLNKDINSRIIHIYGEINQFFDLYSKVLTNTFLNVTINLIRQKTIFC